MSQYDHRQFEGALERVDHTILPTLSRLLGQVLESASLARAGVDAETHAANLRKTARELSELTRLVEAVVPPG
jgi:hypothetical protein